MCKGKAVVTGVAGFIGSHLAERLIAEGYCVFGIDCFTDYYPRAIKEANLSNLRQSSNFHFVEGDILGLNWIPLLDGVDFIFHQAAQAGVRGSWGIGFETYVRNNILVTQQLLETVKSIDTLEMFTFASSSSVYGEAETFPTPETIPLRPVSPYGMTKLACEHLCRIYSQNWGVPTLILRYFTVYGPRQRPDMAFHRFIAAILQDQEIVIYGDGEQTRNFTYVSDVVEANLLSMEPSIKGGVFNIGGGTQISINKVLKLLEEIIGRKARVRYLDQQKGDARNTSADVTNALRLMGYRPHVSLEQGLWQQVEWQSHLIKKQGQTEAGAKPLSIGDPL